MVFKYFTFRIDGDFLNTRPGSPPAFATSPSVASPLACSGCAGVISRFDELQLWDWSRDGGAAEETRDEDSRGRNGSAGKANQIAENQKLVVKLDLHDDRDRSKAMRLVSGFGGIGSLNMDTRDNKLTVSGDFDPVKVVNKLRKSWHTDIVSVGPEGRR